MARPIASTSRRGAGIPNWGPNRFVKELKRHFPLRACLKKPAVVGRGLPAEPRRQQPRASSERLGRSLALPLGDFSNTLSATESWATLAT